LLLKKVSFSFFFFLFSQKKRKTGSLISWNFLLPFLFSSTFTNQSSNLNIIIFIAFDPIHHDKSLVSILISQHENVRRTIVFWRTHSTNLIPKLALESVLKLFQKFDIDFLKTYPSSFYLLYKSLGVKDEFLKFVVCRKCHTHYPWPEKIRETKQLKWTFVEFPNHPQEPIPQKKLPNLQYPFHHPLQQPIYHSHSSFYPYSWNLSTTKT